MTKIKNRTFARNSKILAHISQEIQKRNLLWLDPANRPDGCESWTAEQHQAYYRNQSAILLNQIRKDNRRRPRRDGRNNNIMTLLAAPADIYVAAHDRFAPPPLPDMRERNRPKSNRAPRTGGLGVITVEGEYLALQMTPDRLRNIFNVKNPQQFIADVLASIRFYQGRIAEWTPSDKPFSELVETAEEAALCRICEPHYPRRQGGIPIIRLSRINRGDLRAFALQEV